MLKVLLPTDDRLLTTPGIVAGYEGIGFRPTVGLRKFFDRSEDYQVIHLQWPEEFVGWFREPCQQDFEVLKEALHYWKRRTKVALTMHNLHPHGYGASAKFDELYSLFIECADVIAHFSKRSRELVVEKYPVALKKKHVIHAPDSCELTINAQTQRGGSRTDFCLSQNDFVILVLGSLRCPEELHIIRAAFDAAKVPNKRLIMAGRLGPRFSGFWNLRKRAQWKLWLSRRNATVIDSFIPDAYLSNIVDASDVMLVPRHEGLNSAVVFIGMAFGRMLIVPGIGSLPEHVAGSNNLVYRAHDWRELAAKIETASRMDTNAVGKRNAQIAAGWSWQDNCRSLLDELGHAETSLGQ